MEERTKRVRILKRIDARIGKFEVGQVVILPHDIAQSLIGFRIAEEDKMVDLAPEIKVGEGAQAHRSGPNVTLEVFQGTSKHPAPPPGPPISEKAPAKSRKK
jgi:hypothetical protein